MWIQWIEIKTCQEGAFSGGFREESISWPFLASRGHPPLHYHGPFFHLENQQHGPGSHVAVSDSPSWASLLLLRTLVITGAHPDNPRYFRTFLRSPDWHLNFTCDFNSPLLCNLTSQVSGIRM